MMFRMAFLDLFYFDLEADNAAELRRMCATGWQRLREWSAQVGQTVDETQVQLLIRNIYWKDGGWLPASFRFPPTGRPFYSLPQAFGSCAEDWEAAFGSAQLAARHALASASMVNRMSAASPDCPKASDE